MSTPKISCVPQTLLDWAKLDKVDGDLATSERDRLKQLERENKEPCRANEVLKTASAFFAQAELDCRLKS